jgi:hypothetical protein
MCVFLNAIPGRKPRDSTTSAVDRGKMFGQTSSPDLFAHSASYYQVLVRADRGQRDRAGRCGRRWDRAARTNWRPRLGDRDGGSVMSMTRRLDYKQKGWAAWPGGTPPPSGVEGLKP